MQSADCVIDKPNLLVMVTRIGETVVTEGMIKLKIIRKLEELEKTFAYTMVF